MFCKYVCHRPYSLCLLVFVFHPFDSRLTVLSPVPRARMANVWPCRLRLARSTYSMSHPRRWHQRTLATPWLSARSPGPRIATYVVPSASACRQPNHLQVLISASEDKRLIVHDVRLSPSGKPGSGAVATFSGHSSWVLSVDISPDSRFALSG